MTMLRVKARWTGFQGAPGYSIFHFRDFTQEGFVPADATNATDRVGKFFGQFATFLPQGLNISVEPDCEIIDDATGQLTDMVTGTKPADTPGLAAAGASYAAPAGAVVTWRSSTVRNGRRMRGRTFIVPMSSLAYEANGSLRADALTALNAGASLLRNGTTGPDLVIFGRPSGPGASDGTHGPVTAHTVPDMVALLSSRRD